MTKPLIGVRKRVVINEENYYLTITPTSVDATVPYENRPDRLQERIVIDTICNVITETLESLANGKS